jgi:hypothetical protein
MLATDRAPVEIHVCFVPRMGVTKSSPASTVQDLAWTVLRPAGGGLKASVARAHFGLSFKFQLLKQRKMPPCGKR